MDSRSLSAGEIVACTVGALAGVIIMFAFYKWSARRSNNLVASNEEGSSPGRLFSTSTSIKEFFFFKLVEYENYEEEHFFLNNVIEYRVCINN